MWDYGLFYSSAMSLWFDHDAKLVSIDSDVLEEMTPGEPPKRLDSPEVAAASAEFKAAPHNRRSAAKVLIASLRPGVSADELAPLLGDPSRTLWRYELTSVPGPQLDIVFDRKDALQERALRDR